MSFYHRGRELRLIVHVDDFAYIGPEESAKWFAQAVQQPYGATSVLLGPGGGDADSVRYLNSVITWHAFGVTYEADPAHAVDIVHLLGLEDGRTVGTPGPSDESWQNMVILMNRFKVLRPHCIAAWLQT